MPDSYPQEFPENIQKLPNYPNWEMSQKYLQETQVDGDWSRIGKVGPLSPSLSEPQKYVCMPKLAIRTKSSTVKIMLQMSLRYAGCDTDPWKPQYPTCIYSKQAPKW